MVEDIPELGVVTRAPTLVQGAGRERWLFSKRVVVDTILPGSGLQPRPGPHVPAEAEVAFEVEPRLPSFFVGRVGICRDQRRGKLADAVFQVAVERGGRLVGDIHHRTRLLGVRTDQQRDIVLLPRSERLVGRNGKHIGFDHRVAYAAGVAGERSEEHTSELQSLRHLVCRLLLEKKKHYYQ